MRGGLDSKNVCRWIRTRKLFLFFDLATVGACKAPKPSAEPHNVAYCFMVATAQCASAWIVGRVDVHLFQWIRQTVGFHRQMVVRLVTCPVLQGVVCVLPKVVL